MQPWCDDIESEAILASVTPAVSSQGVATLAATTSATVPAVKPSAIIISNAVVENGTAALSSNDDSDESCEDGEDSSDSMTSLNTYAYAVSSIAPFAKIDCCSTAPITGVDLTPFDSTSDAGSDDCDDESQDVTVVVGTVAISEPAHFASSSSVISPSSPSAGASVTVTAANGNKAGAGSRRRTLVWRG